MYGYDHVPPIKQGGDHLTRLRIEELGWIFHMSALRPQGLNVEFKTTSGMWN